MLAGALMISCLSFMSSASAEQPKGYWPYFTAYQKAVDSGNEDDILSAGDKMLAFYAKFPMNEDIAGMSLVIYRERYVRAIFERRGNYAAAIDNAEKFAAVAEYLGSRDYAIGATARARKIDPMTEVYALTDSPEAALYYGAKHEPVSGTCYGRTVYAAADAGDKHYSVNGQEILSESIASVYVQLGRETAEGFYWQIEPFDDGKHLIHIALNFPEDGDTAPKIISGACDDNLEESLGYLATLKSPVLMRIGGEMNLWQMDPIAFKDAYVHVARLARSLAPNVALVWSPNCVGYWGSDMNDYYPGDAWVDWVGTSLYMNSAPEAGHTADDDDSMYFGRGSFADCVLSMQEVNRVAQAHHKPVIITEGGAKFASSDGTRYEAEAAAQIAKSYSVLTMVYPAIKGIVYFDNNFNGEMYRLADCAAVRSSYNAAVAANPTLASRYGQDAPVYVKLPEFAEVTDRVQLAAYGDTLYGKGMNVTYSLSGKWLAAPTALPYAYTLDTAQLAAGNYEFTAVFNDGAGFTETKTYTLTKLPGGAVTFKEGYTAAPLDEPSSWAREEVTLALDAGLVPETFYGSYTQNITRLDFCRLAVSLLEQKTGKAIGDILSEKGAVLNYGAFTDTFDQNVLAAYALGIVGGRGGGIFDGAAAITREEAAKMLHNLALVLDIQASGASPAFLDDGAFSSWAADSIFFVTAASDKVSGKTVMGSVGGGRFDPKGMYTFQQSYITMLRLFRA
jgi:hypothetical protein